LPVGGHLTLKVYEVLGNEVTALVNEEDDITSLTFNAQRLSK
jgi:hypothetical protein